MYFLVCYIVYLAFGKFWFWFIQIHMYYEPLIFIEATQYIRVLGQNLLITYSLITKWHLMFRKERL